MMPDYVEQSGCWNCKLVFVKEDFDDGPEYYCTLNAPTRPLCGSVMLNEYTLKFHENGLTEDWEEWARNRRVQPWGKCSAETQKRAI